MWVTQVHSYPQNEAHKLLGRGRKKEGGLICVQHSWRANWTRAIAEQVDLQGVFTKDASFLLTIGVFLLTVRLFYLQWGNRKQKRPNPISGQGDPEVKRPNRIFNRKEEDQTEFQPQVKRPSRMTVTKT